VRWATPAMRSAADRTTVRLNPAMRRRYLLSPATDVKMARSAPY
jgi:hypothetical protein